MLKKQSSEVASKARPAKMFMTLPHCPEVNLSKAARLLPIFIGPHSLLSESDYQLFGDSERAKHWIVM
jgi:hypothetical protein